MFDLIAITIGILAFTAWTGLMCTTGYLMRRRHEAREQRRRIARLIADAKASKDMLASSRAQFPESVWGPKTTSAPRRNDA